MIRKLRVGPPLERNIETKLFRFEFTFRKIIVAISYIIQLADSAECLIIFLWACSWAHTIRGCYVRNCNQMIFLYSCMWLRTIDKIVLFQCTVNLKSKHRIAWSIKRKKYYCVLRPKRTSAGVSYSFVLSNIHQFCALNKLKVEAIGTIGQTLRIQDE